MLTSRVPIHHVTAVPAVTPGSLLLVVTWNDGHEAKAIHVHAQRGDVTPDMLADLEAFAMKRDRSARGKLALIE
jgi:hypothetical protein